MTRRLTQMQRWCAKVRLPEHWKEESCWEWIGGRSRKGYGGFHTDLTTSAHRYGYIRFVGPIPEGLQLDHLCRNPSCVNPEHLEAVTCLENQRRGIGPPGRRYTHCRRGHPYTPENTRRRSNPPQRVCRICDSEDKRRDYSKRNRYGKLPGGDEK